MKRKREPAPPGCSACKGTGRVIVRVEAGEFVSGGIRHVQYVEASALCVCPKAVWLAQMERKRKAMRKAMRPTG